jgi:hypothetical protein
MPQHRIAKDTPRSTRITLLATATGLLTAVALCAFSVQAFGATTTTAPTPTTQQIAKQDLVSNGDLIVAALAGLAMFGAACGVIAYTARRRHVNH